MTNQVWRNKKTGELYEVVFDRVQDATNGSQREFTVYRHVSLYLSCPTSPARP